MGVAAAAIDGGLLRREQGLDARGEARLRGRLHECDGLLMQAAVRRAALDAQLCAHEQLKHGIADVRQRQGRHGQQLLLGHLRVKIVLHGAVASRMIEFWMILSDIAGLLLRAVGEGHAPPGTVLAV